MLEIRGLRKTYGNLTVLSDLDLSVPTGALFGLMGTTAPEKRPCSALLRDSWRRMPAR